MSVGGLAYLKAPEISITPAESFQFFKPARTAILTCDHISPLLDRISSYIPIIAHSRYVTQHAGNRRL